MDANTSLETKTQAYWNTSAAFHGKPSQYDITTEKALKVCGDSIMYLGPHRPLAFRMSLLQESIIMGTTKKRTKKSEQQNAQVLQMPKRVSAS